MKIVICKALFTLFLSVFVQESVLSKNLNLNPKEKLESLQKIDSNRSWLLQNLREKKKKLKEEDLGVEEKKLLKKEVAVLERKISFEEYQFVEVATGVFIERGELPRTDSKKDLSKQIKEILMPLLEGLRRISERPRKIELYKGQIELYKKTILTREKALKRVDELIEKEQYSGLKKSLILSRNMLLKEKRNLEFDLTLSERSLRKIEGKKSSFFNEAGEALTEFLGTKGKNLFLSVSVLFLFFYSFMICRNRLFALLHLSDRFLFLKKTFMALYGVIAFTVSLFASLLCLYYLNDWLLVTIACIFIFGILWSLKQVAPELLDEARLILNLGTVREGERVYYKGVPWKVDSLNFLCSLTNDSLEGGSILVRAKDMMNHQSRPMAKDEDMFPTKKGNWISLKDGSFGEVILQTPDQVLLRTLGGSQLYYQTPQFLSLFPENLSHGYFIEVVLKVDYQLQKKVLELLTFFKEGFEEQLNSHEMFKGHIKKMMVEFKAQGEHAFELWVRVDAEGAIAPEKFTLERFIHKTFIELCNEKEMTIPLEQLKIHGQAYS